jgi:hypothetical protein
VLAQLHAHETQDTFDANMTALESQGAPVTHLISDGDIAAEDENLANSSDFTSAAGYLVGGMNALGQVETDLQVLNQHCGQPASNWKGDIY